MASRNLAAEAMESVADAIHGLRADLARREPMPEQRGYRTYPGRLGSAALALRFCRDAETGESLAGLMRPVPAEFINRTPDGQTVVRCVCGSEHPRGELVECPGSCGRWFIGDEGGVWAARLPES